MNQATPGSTGSNRPWWRRIGPGLITACVVIGPGSILTSSKVGATDGYSMLWVVVVAVFLMAVYMRMGARLGVVSGDSPGNLLATRPGLSGRPLAILIGCSVFFISASFQFGNNLGVHSAFQVFFDFEYTIVFFNLLTLVFLFALRDFYRTLERMMSFFVGLMLIAFAVNLCFARPSIPAMAKGFIPATGELDWALLGLVGTTFVISAAFYQAYLVRQKGWTQSDLKDGAVDVRVSAVIMAAITIMLICTAATVLPGQDLSDVVQVARSLEPLFGETGVGLFCLGLFSAAYSSFLINALIGGFILSDGLGLGSKPNDFWPRIFTAAIMLIGMGMALAVIKLEFNPYAAIVTAQAVTVIAAPMLAATLWWLTSCRDVMGEHANRPGTHVAAAVGFLMLLSMASYTVIFKILPALQSA